MGEVICNTRPIRHQYAGLIATLFSKTAIILNNEAASDLLHSCVNYAEIHVINTTNVRT